MADLDLDDIERRMDGAVNALRTEFAGLRTGRASASLLEPIHVEAYGARMPKSLMLYVKNLIFLDSAIATLAPELDMFAVVTEIGTHFATTHGAAIAAQLGMPAEPWEIDMDGVKAGFGVDPATTDRLTYAELKERRALIQKRLTGRLLD